MSTDQPDADAYGQELARISHRAYSRPRSGRIPVLPFRPDVYPYDFRRALVCR